MNSHIINRLQKYVNNKTYRVILEQYIVRKNESCVFIVLNPIFYISFLQRKFLEAKVHRQNCYLYFFRCQTLLENC